MRPRGRSDIPTKSDKELVHGCQLLRGMNVEGNRSRVEDRSVTVSTTTTSSMGLSCRVREVCQTLNHSCEQDSMGSRGYG